MSQIYLKYISLKETLSYRAQSW